MRFDFHEFKRVSFVLLLCRELGLVFSRRVAEPSQSSVRGILKNSFDWPRFFIWARIALFATREQQFTMNAVSVRILSSWALEINAQDPHRCARKRRSRQGNGAIEPMVPKEGPSGDLCWQPAVDLSLHEQKAQQMMSIIRKFKGLMMLDAIYSSLVI